MAAAGRGGKLPACAHHQLVIDQTLFLKTLQTKFRPVSFQTCSNSFLLSTVIPCELCRGPQLFTTPQYRNGTFSDLRASPCDEGAER